MEGYTGALCRRKRRRNHTAITAQSASEISGANQMAVPPTAKASRSSAPDWNASPRPTEMQIAPVGRSTAVRKPPMRMLLPSSR